MRIAPSLFLACTIVASASARSAAQSPPKTTPTMEKVTGIGGFFFKSSDHKALAEWYEKHLGVTCTPTSYDGQPWEQEKGITIFAPFSADSKYFGRFEQQWMINFRVRDLDAMAAQLTRAAITVKIDPQTYPNGRFALLHDPEGNPIQLWEPKNPADSKPE